MEEGRLAHSRVVALGVVPPLYRRLVQHLLVKVHQIYLGLREVVLRGRRAADALVEVYSQRGLVRIRHRLYRYKKLVRALGLIDLVLLVLGGYVAAELPQGLWHLLSFDVVALEVILIVVLVVIRLLPTQVF